MHHVQIFCYRCFVKIDFLDIFGYDEQNGGVYTDIYSFGLSKQFNGGGPTTINRFNATFYRKIPNKMYKSRQFYKFTKRKLQIFCLYYLYKKYFTKKKNPLPVHKLY